MLKIILLLLSFNAFASDFSVREFIEIDSDSGIRGPAYQRIVEELENLGKLHPDIAQVVTYGQSLGGRPLTLVKIARPGIPSRRAIYIGGSIHGNEYLNIEDRLPSWFLSAANSATHVRRYLDEGGVIYIAPILNPDGYDRRERENGNDVDLNRDYTVREAKVEGFKEPETKALFNYLSREHQQGIKLDVAMDYHCCIGALLYPWSFTGPVLPDAQKDRHLKIAEIMQTFLGKSMKAGTTPTILGYSAKGTSKDFYYEHFGALGFTYEGRRNIENSFFHEHTLMWDGILGWLNEK